VPRHFIVLGAGISGLATGWFIKQRFPDDHLTILEKTSRPGGWIQSIHLKGFLFEQGPRSCRPQGAGLQTLALIEALGLQEEVICPAPEAHQRFIYYQNKLQPLPKRLREVPFSPLMKGWAKALWQDWRAPMRQTEDESIASFFKRRLGDQWVKRLIDPFTLGIYAGDCERLSLQSCFPNFDAWERQGSLFKGAWQKAAVVEASAWVQSFCKQPLFSFKNGMETLPRALAMQLKECLHYQQDIQAIYDKSVLLKTGEEIRGDYIISTLPTYALASLVPQQKSLQKLLKELSYTTVAIVHLGFHNRLPLKGFGYLVPSSVDIPFLGCVWDSSVFPQQNRENCSCLTVMLGGSHHPQVATWSEEKMIGYVLETLKQHLGFSMEPTVIHCQIAHQAIPQYEVGYAEWKKQVQESSSLILSGNGLRGVAVNDCIAYSKQLVNSIGS